MDVDVHNNNNINTFVWAPGDHSSMIIIRNLLWWTSEMKKKQRKYRPDPIKLLISAPRDIFERTNFVRRIYWQNTFKNVIKWPKDILYGRKIFQYVFNDA